MSNKMVFAQHQGRHAELVAVLASPVILVKNR